MALEASVIRTVQAFPHKVRETMTLWIPMPDGVRLAARVWMPEDAERNPVPALFEMTPYRRRDGAAAGDAINHRYFSGHGYATIKLDVRGSGDSEGRIDDEYSEAELQDGVDAIAWIAQQNWCTGAVGMFGNSWGGFNSLQVAARQPPALKAIISFYASDDRYADDCHYMGGCLIHDNMRWGSQFFNHCTRPPDPNVVGERWREMWFERLNSMPLPMETWLSHQRRDAYWKRGSVCEDFAKIKCAVYAVGGFNDGYTNAVLRLMAGLPGPKKALIGPWSHARIPGARPGPDIGWLQEAIRWWNYWLKGTQNGIMDEPMIRVWVMQSIPPATQVDVWPGRWVAEPAWPSPNIRTVQFALNADRIDPEPRPEAPLALQSPLSVGGCAGEWNPHGDGPNLADDQRADDGLSLCFESEPLPEHTDIVGACAVELELASDKPNAFIAVRLNDVAPTGEATRITYGLLNLTHHRSHEHPEPLVPGRRHSVRIELKDIAYSVPPGHRLRVSLSTTYWLLAWPSPEVARLTVYAGRSWLRVPIRPPREEDARLHPFAEPEAPPAPAITQFREPRPNHVQQRDAERREISVTSTFDRGAFRLHDVDVVYEYSGQMTYRISGNDPLSANMQFTKTQRLEREGWKIRTETRANLTSTLKHFLLSASVDAFEDERRVFARVWNCRIPRDHL
jgi:putative CocE/NonD family hydrolase